MSWLGSSLGSEQRAVLEVVDEVMRGVDADDTPRVRQLPTTLAKLGLWTVGVPEELGGGGADWATAALVIERISRTVPELGVACARAAAAARALAGAGHDNLLEGLHAGNAEVVVIEMAASHVGVTAVADRWEGRVGRFDAFDPDSAHLLLMGEQSALIEPSGIEVGKLQRTTGLSSFRTVHLMIDAESGHSAHRLRSDAATVRAQLLAGVAAVATGIAGAAFDAAAAYAAQRHQFGGPISSLRAVHASLTDQALQTASLTRAVLSGPPEPLGSIAIARTGCDIALEVADAALQIHGGYGYLREYPAERSVRDAVSLRALVDLTSAISILQRQSGHNV